jgi:hypothetical protein
MIHTLLEVISQNFNSVMAVCALIVVVYAVRKRRHISPELPGNPILSSYYTEGKHVGAIKNGVLGDLHYSAMVTANVLGVDGGQQVALLYRVELPFTTRIHLLGIPKKNQRRTPGSHTRQNTHGTGYPRRRL